jgi:hypothetical protein
VVSSPDKEVAMPRIAAFVLIALTLTAAAPPGGPWLTGWDRPSCPDTGCQFDREGGRLTITATPGWRGLDVSKEPLNVPHLLRDVEGDFVLRCRVKAGSGTAGLLLVGGEGGASVEIQAATEGGKAEHRVEARIESRGGAARSRWGGCRGRATWPTSAWSGRAGGW